MAIILEVLFILLLLVIAATTAASEISIISASRIKLKRLASEGSRSARQVMKILETPERFFGTVLVVNNIVDTLIAAIVTAVVIRVLGGQGQGIAIATIVGAFLIIIFEVAAKTFAARHADRMSLLLARPIGMLIKVFYPVVRILEIITNKIVGLISKAPSGRSSLVTEEEIRALIMIGAEEDVTKKEKYRMLTKVFEFSDALVRDVMTPKKDMQIISINADFVDMMSEIVEYGYSRIPVYKDTPDNIVGVINAKDLLSLTCNRELIVMQDILNPVTFVPGTKKVTEMLKEFQKGHTHLAMVTDTQGR